MDLTVLWHDVECGAYAADLPLWRELAAEADGPVLDLGAGTGRVALDLAARGHEVWALDLDEALLAALAERAAGLPVRAVAGDARGFALERRFALVLAPMQTMQLLGGPDGRRRCLSAVRDHLLPGGRFAAAVACEVEPFGADDDPAGVPVPDMREVDGTVYASCPVAIVVDAGGFVLRRRREVVDRSGARSLSEHRVRLDGLDAATLAAEAGDAGLRPEPSRRIPATDEHVASEVVIARG